MKITMNCFLCGENFERSKSDIKKNLKIKKQVFCSISCSKKHNNIIKLEKGFSENKICSRCSEEKPRTSEYFPKHTKTLDKFDSWCKICRASYRSHIRRGQYRSMITDEELIELLKTEECTICGSMEKLVVDHDHNRNFVRGVLCNHCNRGLGHFRDDPLLLEFAKMYLQSNSDNDEELSEFNNYMQIYSDE